MDLNGQTVGAEAITLNGTGISSGGALINSSGSAASLSGNITLASASSIGGSGNATFSGTVNGGFDLTLVDAGTKTFSGVIGGTTPLTSITQSDGTGAVQFNENVSVGSGGVTFNANVTLDGLTLTSGGAVAFGDAATDTLTISGAATTVTTSSGNLTLNATTTGNESLTLNLAGGITFNAPVTMAADKNFSATSTTGISLSNSAADISTSGTGTLSVIATRQIDIDGGSLTTVNGDLTVSANAAGTTGGAFTGVSLVNGATISSSGTGDIEVIGHGGAAGGDGVFSIFGGAILSTGTGAVAVTGTGGGGASDNRGIFLFISGKIGSVTGDITVTGQGGGGAGTLNHGIWLISGGTIESTGAADITVVGSGGTGGGDVSSGVSTSGGSIRGTGTSSGTITVTGTAGSGANSYGLELAATSYTAIQSNNQAITIIADSLSMTPSINAGTGTVTFRQKTAGTAINLGGADAAGVLGLTDAELDQVTAGTINIGNANSGAITISEDITRAANTNINLTTGSGNNIAFGTFSLNAGSGGDVSLTTSGSGAITTDDNTGTDLTGDDVTLTAGSGGIASATNFLRLAATTVSATTSGNGSINLVELDSVSIASPGLNAGSGTITLGGGTFLTTNTGSILSSAIIASGATIGGTGTTAAVTTQSGGNVAPGTSPGVLNTGNIVLVSGSTVVFEIGGTTAGNANTNHDQLNVTGTVSLGNATLSTAAFNPFVPASGNTFIIILNDAADAITGTFNGLAQGATISTDFLGSGLTATISYVGGTGNDVVIIVS